MTAIDQLIGELLVRHNCVIVPMFGGFVAKPTPATIDFERGVMLPPGKSLLFNRQLINNDGLLISELATRLNVTYDNASITLKEKVGQWNNILISGGRVELDKVGHLFYDSERNICFEQDRFFNLLLESFGLGQVQFMAEEKAMTESPRIEVEPKINQPKEDRVITTKVIEMIPEPILVETEEEEEIVGDEKPIIVKRRQAWKYVAAACLLPIAFYSFWIPMKTDVLESGIVSIKDFNPFYSSTEGVYHKTNLVDQPESYKANNSLEQKLDELPSDVSSYSYKIDNSQYVLVKLNKNADSESTSSENQNEIEQGQIVSNSMNYVVGCFSSEENAKNLVSKLKSNGLDARIVDFHNGLHRVTAGSAISIEALKEIQSTAISLGFKGWVLK